MTPTDYQSKILARVKESEDMVRFFVDEYGQMTKSTEDALFAPYRALRVAVEGHGDNGHGECKSCVDYFNTRTEQFSMLIFPCPELKAIGEEMGIDEDI